jgi:hypothetical protein
MNALNMQFLHAEEKKGQTFAVGILKMTLLPILE